MVFLTKRRYLDMSQFNNVTITKEANIYFDGKVTSRTVFFVDGLYVTLPRKLGIVLHRFVDFVPKTL
jgi:hypothetical protein